ncbi:MAG: DUF5703 domain-containing protein [bacterium]
MKFFPTSLILFLAAILTLSIFEQEVIAQNDIERYNVLWNSPSKDYNGSMPLGNGDVTCNAWVEESGDMVFYIGKSDSWDDNGRLLKIGRVRIKLDPAPQSPLLSFNQELNLPDATINVQFGEAANKVDIRLWIDVNNPVINIEIISAQNITATATIELWRTIQYELPNLEVSDVLTEWSSENKRLAPMVIEPDFILKNQENKIGWFHRNVKSIGPNITANMQGLQDFQREDPLRNRTFGAVIKADNAQRIDDFNLSTNSLKNHRFSIYILTKHPVAQFEWRDEMDELISKIENIPFEKKKKAHKDWWKNFWNRSWINVHSVNLEDSTSTDETFVISQSYNLQRFITACAGRGQYPIKFNGSTFTVPYQDAPDDADYRRWGPGYWWQNTRLPYYPMCSSGDFEMMMPLFKMYAKDLMPLFKYRTKLYFNHDGAFIPECIYFWGDVFTESYGLTPFNEREDKLQESRWHKWEWVSGLELVYLMLDYYSYTQDENFLDEYLLPTANEIITFFDQHYETDDYTLIMEPSQAAETWWECINPMPEVSGLHSIVGRLLELPNNIIRTQKRKYLHNFRERIPDLPIREINDTLMLAPAEDFEEKMNVENPELYAVFPFRLVTFNNWNKQLAIDAFKYRTDRGNYGWRQDDLFAAYLGMVDTVKQYLVGRAKNKNIESRFPAFWGPNYDWTPDQDHGSVLMKSLQSMLMQTDDKKIYLLPAWPKDWNADFKLFAPFNTVIQCEVKKGKITKLVVEPESRKADIVIVPAQ